MKKKNKSSGAFDAAKVLNDYGGVDLPPKIWYNIGHTQKLIREFLKISLLFKVDFS